MPARLQVLYLPSIPDEDPRFGLVLDQAIDVSGGDRDALREFAREVGAQGVLVTSHYVDVDQGDDDDEQSEPTVLAIPVPQSAPEPPKLPPAHTTEGKAARVWGGTDGKVPRDA